MRLRIGEGLHRGLQGLVLVIIAASAAGDPGGHESNSEALRSAKELLPRGFREYETARFVVLSNAGRRWTRDRADVLDRTADAFERHVRLLGLRPQPVPHKMVCVVFDKRSEFAEFARDHDGVNAEWGLGYYSPAHRRTVFFNGETEADADEFAASRSVATAIHETVHQLHFETRVQSIHVQYPLWCIEGLATAFETADPSEPFGPGFDFAPRRDRFHRLLERDRLVPLHELVRLDRMPVEHGRTIHTVYNQSYALVSWLARHRAKELREYLLLMLAETPGRPSPARHFELFEQAFGDVDLLEAEWLAAERRALGAQDRGNRP